MTSIADDGQARQRADVAAEGIARARSELKGLLDGADDTVEVPVSLLRDIVKATRLRCLNEIRDAAFREGAEAFEDTLINVRYHPQSTGIWNPYIRRPWDGRYGATCA